MKGKFSIFEIIIIMNNIIIISSNIHTLTDHKMISEAYPGLSQTSKMERFAIIVNTFARDPDMPF